MPLDLFEHPKTSSFHVKPETNSGELQHRFLEDCQYSFFLRQSIPMKDHLRLVAGIFEHYPEKSELRVQRSRFHPLGQVQYNW